MSVTEQVLVFRVSDSTFGIPIQKVREVLNWQRPTPLPDAPPAVEGMIDLRGQVVPVINLSSRLGFGTGRSGAGARTIVVELDDRLVGLVVDEVTEVRHLPPDQVQPPGPEVMPARGQPLVSGIARMSDRLIILLDPMRLGQPVAEMQPVGELAGALNGEGRSDG